MSSNATTVYQEGRREASAAVSAATSLGFAKDRVIYYDLEGYAPATLACRTTVQSFLKGWTERLHELGASSGVYGSAYSSYMSDWASINPPPDYVWIASWYRSYYDPDATVWGIRYLSDSLWSDHQRIRQYAGDHVETWGGISFTIDSNVSDGAVTVLPRTAASSMDFEIQEQPAGHPDSLREMQQVSVEQGWVIQGQQLLWTDNGGISWKDITPPIDPSAVLLNGFFVDGTRGWLVIQNQENDEVSIYRTEDGGANWQPSSIDHLVAGFDPQVQFASISFIDPQTGWVSLTHASSSNFSLGSLYGTLDGGQTWSMLAVPIGGPVFFLDSRRGWVAGGASGDELYVTSDGGMTWEDQGLRLEPKIENGELYFGLPAFVNASTGYLSITIADPGNPRIEIFVSEDAGTTWKHFTSVHLDPATLPGSQIPLKILDKNRLLITSGGLSQVLSIEPGKAGALNAITAGLPGGVQNLEFSEPASGWAYVKEGECEGYKPKPGESIQPGQDPFRCDLRSRLYKTQDGGMTWTEITP